MRLTISDLVILCCASLVALVISGVSAQRVVAPPPVASWNLDHLTVSLVLVLCWTAALAASGSRHYRVIGAGTLEFKALFQSTLVMLFVVCFFSYGLKMEVSRLFILAVLPIGLVGLLASRALWRQWLSARRQRGEFCSRVLIVGAGATASHIATDLQRHRAAGYHVVGSVLTRSHEVYGALAALPTFTSVEDLLRAVAECQADTIIVTDGHDLSPADLRRLSWSLETGRQHLVMAPSLTDIAGPRIHTRPVAGLPLVHVETPRYEGSDRFLKRALDVGVSAGLLLLLSLPLLVVALLVRLSSPGSIFYGHERIGKDGKPFRMLKFRSMVADADSHLAALLAAQGTADKPLFKIANDPRITPIGAFLRRYSIDEIPQLLNVLRGEMSLVGPRPQVVKEVALYDHAAARRLYVKPGMTGLWQVSGRSNLTWDQSIRLDLSYVENWSLTADIVIMARTVRAVLAKDGAV